MHIQSRCHSKLLGVIQPNRSQPVDVGGVPDRRGGVAFALLTVAAVVMPGARAACQTPASAQQSPYSVQLPTEHQVSPSVAFTVSLAPVDAKPGETVTLAVKADIQPGWHVSALGEELDDSPSLPTSIGFEALGLTPIDAQFTPSVKPSPVKVGDATDLQHSGSLVWQRKYRVIKQATTYSGTGTIRFQACDKDVCLAPITLPFTLGAKANAPTTPALLQSFADKAIGKPTNIALSDTNLERRLVNTAGLVTADPKEDFDEYVKQLTTSMRARESLTLGGEIEKDGSSVTLYLADQENYSLVNTGSGNTNFENTSTYISIDYNGDGQIESYESLASNLPIRIFDSMFLVTEISKSKKLITLQQVDIPLAGAVLNRRCPDFSYETVDGQTVSNKSILGKTTILDVWAVT